MMTFPPSTRVLSGELTRHQRFRDCILSEIPDLDAETLADTLEGITDLRGNASRAHPLGTRG